MSERTSGVLVGGILGLIGAILAFVIWFLLLPSAIGFLGSLTAGAFVGFLGLIIILIGSAIAIIFSILLIAGKAITVSAILVLIAGIISAILILALLWFIIPAVLEILGGILALATKG